MNFSFGNKPVGAAPPAFGAPNITVPASIPGSVPANNTGFTFGATTTANKPATGMFGSDASKPGGFSFTSPTANPTTPSIFGASPAAPNFSFGSPQTTQSQMFGGGITSTAQPTTGFGFGAQPAQSTAAFSGFGSPSAIATTAVGITPATTGLSFGAKPANAWPSFGATPPASSAINFGATSVAPATTATALGQNFSFAGNNPLQQAPTAAPTASFGFGQSTAAPPSNPATTGFGFGQVSSPPAIGLGLGMTAAKPALSFGASPNVTVAPNVTLNPVGNPPSLGFGLPTSASPMFSFGGATGVASTAATITTAPAPAPAPAPSFGFSTPATSAVPTFGKPVATAAPTTGFNFNTSQPAVQPPQTTALSFGTGGPPAFGSIPASTPGANVAQIPVAKPTVGTSFANVIPQTKPADFSFGGSTIVAPAATTAATATLSTPGFTGFQLPAPPVPATTQSIALAVSNAPTSIAQPLTLTSLGTLPPPSSTTTPGSLAIPSVSSSLARAGFQLTAASSAATTSANTGSLTLTTSASSAPTQPTPVTSMNFGQLEDTINKWSLELEEQEKVFINQATQVNAWDKLLIANGEKIVTLNEALQGVRTEQQGLDHELDFVLGQQRELEELLVPLEKELSNVVITDPEREQTYRLTDTIDTQLKQMSEDLKEIIEHLNESNRREDNNDPIVQIGRILNAHMSSMQWIDSSIAQISNKLDQLSNMHNMLKRHNKRSFKLTYK
ncbi:nucleoporin 62 [Arctopsyche grandis]|uniref:nucleoporin 62 n=1 Tax=Arctopsyche grandis TaxID=121162 RepID=UPI00406D74A0